MSANKAKFTFKILGTDHDTAVLDFNAVEKVSYPFGVMLTLVSGDAIQVGDVVGNEALLTVRSLQNDKLIPTLSTSSGSSDRYFHGVIRKFRHTGLNGRYHIYETQVVPSFWRLSLKRNCRIFQNMKVQEIVGAVLEQSAVTSDRYEFRLQHEDIVKKFCVQFQETDFHFVSRLLEEEGIFYFFEHYEDRHVLVFCDTEAFYRDIAGNYEISFNQGGGMVAEQESISAFNLSQRLRPGAYTHKNYNFKNPSLDLTANFSNDSDWDQFEVYDYPGSYGEPERGNRLARVRNEEIHALQNKGKGASNCVCLTPGARFHLKGHERSDFNNKYLLLEVTHGGTQPGVLGEQSPEGATPGYSNAFMAIPASVTYRPERRHRKPVIPGIQSAKVTGPPGEEIYPDQYGRVKVQFPWDREGKGDEKTSCWLRVSQIWNGSTWGSQFIPRVGDEVLVAFINGDMDYPIIVGSAVNEANQPNYNLPANKTQSGIRTRSYPNGNPDNYNELRFEDRKGSEEVYLQGEKDWNILIKNDKGQYVGHDETLNVRNNRNKTVGVDQVLTVGSNDTETIGANKTETIGANKTETVAINKMETIGLAKELSIGGLYQVTVSGIMNETVACAKTEEVGLAKAVFVGTTMMENVVGDRTTNIGANLTETIDGKYSSKANEYIIEASKITFKSGSSTIVMDGNSITIKANKVFTN